MPDDTHIDLSQRVAALEQMLVARTAEHDDGLQQESATRLTLPLDGEVRKQQRRILPIPRS